MRSAHPFVVVVFLVALLAGCAGDIKIGVVNSETGIADFYGKQVREGLDLALEEVNAAGGVEGKPIQLIYRDDESRADVGVRVTQELIDVEGVDAIIGAVTSEVTLEIAPICESSRVVLLSPTSSSPKITMAGEYIYRNYPSDVLEGTSMADFARNLGLERIVIFALDNEFGIGLKQVFTEKYENKFRQVVKVYDFGADTSTYPAMIEETKKEAPDGVYIIGYVRESAELLKQIRAAGIRSVIMGTASVTEDVIDLAGKSAEYLIYPRPPFEAGSDDPAVAEFVSAYEAKYGYKPEAFAAYGYDALKLMALAIERGGSTHPDSIRSGLGNISNYQGASGRASFDSNGDIVQYPRLVIIHEGAPVPYKEFLEKGHAIELPGR